MINELDMQDEKVEYGEQAQEEHGSQADAAQVTDQVHRMVEEAVAQWKKKYFYLSADFENFKRRSSKEYESMRIDIYARILKPLLTIMDDFERALPMTHHEQDRQGFALIAKSIEKLLTECGVKEMEVGAVFDPERHEALMHVESPEHTSDQIVALLQKGYLFNNEVVLRPAKVSVAR